MRNPIYTLLLLGSLLLTTACQSTDQNNSEETTTVDYEQLQSLLPRRLAGMERVAIEGEKIGFLGLKYSQATAEYENAEAWAEIVILDGGGIARVFSQLVDNIDTDFDREYENTEGYQRSIKVSGFPATEQYSHASKEGTFTVFIESRFLLHLEAEDISERQFKRLCQALDIRRLSRLK